MIVSNFSVCKSSASFSVAIAGLLASAIAKVCLVSSSTSISFSDVFKGKLFTYSQIYFRCLIGSLKSSVGKHLSSIANSNKNLSASCSPIKLR